jgi:peptide/nickel transport system permease protein
MQLVLFLAGVARMDFGTSIWHSRPALAVVLERLPLTLELAAATMLISVVLAFVLGSVSAMRPLSLVDRLTSAISLIGVATPNFWLALMLILLFAVRLGWLPTSGTGGPKYLILPVIVLAWGPIGAMAQVTRASLVEQLGATYVMAARAKGLSERALMSRHILRNGLIPVITIAGVQFIALANGAVIVETVFGWPGIGKLTIDAIQRRDFAILQATVFVVAMLVVLVNLLLDFVYAAVDPRIRYE